MSLRTTNEQKGFTIIEVVLVLAIAGLIFLIVFLALPQLQKSRRDTQRRNDLGRVMSSLETYAGSNSGAYPASSTELATFKTTYIDNANLKDPSTGSSYALTWVTTTDNSSIATGTINYKINATCGSGGNFAAGSGDRNIATAVKLENGGIQCQANQ